MEAGWLGVDVVLVWGWLGLWCPGGRGVRLVSLLGAC